MYEYQATVHRIVDADTLDLNVDLGMGVFTRQRIRLARVDAWEVRGEEREKGMAAKVRVAELLAGTEDGPMKVIIRTKKDKRGKYGRYIAEVIIPARQEDGILVPEVNLSDKLVAEGHAEYWHSK